MKPVHIATFLAGGSLAAASSLLLKRWDYDLCLNDCSLAGVPMPDQNTFQLLLENYWSEQCLPLSIGDPNDPVATSTVCLTFVGTDLQFTFAPFSDYTIVSVGLVWNKLTGTSTAGTISCDPGSGGTFVCKLPFSTILGVPDTTSTVVLLEGMCPNGDRDALAFRLQLLEFAGAAAPDSGGDPVEFRLNPPCRSRAPDGSCKMYFGGPPQTEVTYRCTKCNVGPCPHTCTCGTAFGYQNPVKGVQKSFTVDTQPGEGCNRWGWYETPTLAELRSGRGIGGPLYVGAGGNDITQAISVGSWSAKADAQGRVTVAYQLKPPYVLAGAHVDLECLPVTTCTECTYDSGPLDNLSLWTSPLIQYPTCSGGSRVALMLHADVNTLTTTTTCAPPVAT